MTAKKCSKCGLEKPLALFYKQPLGKFGLMAHCKVCSNNYHTEWINKKYNKVCPSCSKELPRGAFHKARDRFSGLASHCKECRAKRYPYDPAAHRKVHLRNRYGLEWESYISLFLSQNERCKICGSKLDLTNKDTHLDHCHTTGKVRAFLCRGCNLGIGAFKEDIKKLKLAVTYLEEYNGH